MSCVTGYSSHAILAMEQHGKDLANSVMERAEAICKDFKTTANVFLIFILLLHSLISCDLTNLYVSFIFASYIYTSWQWVCADENGESSWVRRCQGCDMHSIYI